MTTLVELVTAEPDPTFGRPVSNIEHLGGGWRVVYELADPGAGTSVEWFDITEIVDQGPAGHDLTRGGDEFDGRYRASVVYLDLYAPDDRLAPWLDDTSSTFGVHVPLGAGLLVRGSLIQVVDDVVAVWNPRFTNKVERWGDASLARGQVRRHAVVARDLITSLVAVSLPESVEQNWSDRVDFILTQSAWPYGSQVYGAQFTSAPADMLTLPARDAQSSALAELQATLDPAGLIYYTDRRGVLIIRPRHDDTFHADAFAAGASGTPWPQPDPVVFSHLALDDPGILNLAAYAIDTNQAEPFGFPDSEDAVRNRVVVTVAGSTVYDDDDPTSIQRHDPRELPLSWLAANNALAATILATRAHATREAVPLYVTEDLHGFFPGPAGIDYYHPVEVVHQTAAGRETAAATGVLRQYRERVQPGLNQVFVNLAFTVDVHGDITVDASLLPVHTLLLEDVADTFAEFSWINPEQVIEPTHTQVRMLNPASLWATVDYPLDGIVWGGLDPNTAYIFQVRLIRVVDGLITHFSPSTTYGFTTTWTAPIVDIDEDGDGDVTFPPPPCGSLDWELQESDDGTTWTIIDDGTVTTPPWTVDLSGYTFDPTKAYRIRQDACGDTTYSYPFAGACTDPPALAAAPFDDADLVEYWPGICPPDRVVAAISEEEAIHGPCFDGFVLDGDLNVVLVATGQGLVAYGQIPAAVVGITGDATISARVLVSSQPDGPVVAFGIAALWIDLIADGANWAVRGRAHEAGAGITTITPGTLELDFGAWYDIALVHDVAAGDLLLYVDGVEVASALGTVGVRHDFEALGEFYIGQSDNGLITNCALWDRVLVDSELPGYVPPLTVTINQAAGQADPAAGGDVLFDVVFSEAVSGFSTGDITLSGTAGATTAAVSGSGTTFLVTVSGMTGAGTVTASIAAAVCTAVATGAPNDASTSTDNTVTWAEPFDPATDMANLDIWIKGGDWTLSGSDITALNNDGGLGGTFVPGATTPATVGAQINGLDTIAVAGASTYTSSSVNRWLSDDIYDVYAVVKASAQVNKAVWSQHAGTVVTGRCTWNTANDGTGAKAAIFFNNGSSHSGNSADTAFDNTPHVVRWYSTGGGDHYIQVDGGTPTLAVTGQAFTPLNTSLRLFCIQAANFLTGTIGEMLMCDSVQANAADVNNYLMDKWGI